MERSRLQENGREMKTLSARLTAVFTRVFLWLRADMYRTLQDWRTWESIKAELKAIERRERATKIGGAK
jgi:hypothetical protein